MIEKSDRLGGRCIIFRAAVKKMEYFIDFKKQLEDYQVKIIFNTEATVDMIKVISMR
jgi:hypothetical protein